MKVWTLMNWWSNQKCEVIFPFLIVPVALFVAFVISGFSWSIVMARRSWRKPYVHKAWIIQLQPSGNFQAMMVSINLLPLIVVVAALGVMLVNGEFKKIPLWADLYLRSHTDWEDIDFKLAFLMDNYNVVSLEKCLYQGSNGQDTVSIVDELPTRVCFFRRVFSRKKNILQINVGNHFCLIPGRPSHGRAGGQDPNVVRSWPGPTHRLGGPRLQAGLPHGHLSSCQLGKVPF